MLGSGMNKANQGLGLDARIELESPGGIAVLGLPISPASTIAKKVDLVSGLVRATCRRASCSEPGKTPSGCMEAEAQKLLCNMLQTADPLWKFMRAVVGLAVSYLSHNGYNGVTSGKANVCFTAWTSTLGSAQVLSGVEDVCMRYGLTKAAWAVLRGSSVRLRDAQHLTPGIPGRRPFEW